MDFNLIYCWGFSRFTRSPPIWQQAVAILETISLTVLDKKPMGVGEYNLAEAQATT